MPFEQEHRITDGSTTDHEHPSQQTSHVELTTANKELNGITMPSRKQQEQGDDVELGSSGPSPPRSSTATTLEWNVKKVVVGKGRKSKDILNDIAGKTESGQFTALLGPSGSGKTTLLHSLSLRNRHFEGNLRMNGKAPGSDYLVTTALVHQSQVLFGFMTPREHLTFQAIARMSRHHTKAQIAARVEEVLQEARLEKCSDTLIGGQDQLFLRRGISGGERRRVAVATELILCPQIIFLDEPTSGLDSVMAEVVVSILSDLSSKRGRIVLTCLHCPSSELMTYFTHLLLLTHDGRLAYHGPRAAAVSFFETLGYKYPLDFNPADYLLRVLSCPDAGSSKDLDAALVAQEEAKRMAGIAQAYRDSTWAVGWQLLPPDQAHKSFQRIHGRGADDLTLLGINSWRYYLLLKRDVVTTGVWGLCCVVLGLLFGVLFLGQASTNWRNLMGLLFALSCTVLLVGSLANVVRFPMEWAPFAREYFAGSNAVGPYMLSRYVLVLPYMVGPVIMATIVYWMTGMRADFGAYLWFCGIMSLSMVDSMALGQLASCISHNVLIGLAATPAFLTPMILFSGLLYQRGSVPAWLSWLEDLSIMNYTFSALLIQQAKILRDGSGDLLLKFLVLDPRDFMHDVGMLVALFFAMNVLTYTCLTVRMRFASDIV